MNMDPQVVSDWLNVIVKTVIPLAIGLVGVWFNNNSKEEKVKAAVPIVWGVVQQELRKSADKRLPGGQVPLQRALDLIKEQVKLTPKLKNLATLALKAFHEKQGHPDPGVEPSANVAIEVGPKQPPVFSTPTPRLGVMDEPRIIR